MRKYIYILVTLSLILLSGCSADEPLSVPGADGQTSLNLLIPSTEMALAGTRADNSAHGAYLATEGKFNTLAVAGFYEDNGTKKHFYMELDENEATTVESVYRSYKINVVPATYRLYVLANIPLSSSMETQLKATTTPAYLEDNLKGLYYEYSTLPTADTGLPMQAMQTVNVEENREKQVVVNLEYVCAKVRLTVLYNNAYGNDNPFMITGLSVNNAYDSSRVFLTGTMTHGTGFHAETFNSQGTHYDLSADLASKPLSYWTDKPASESSDPLNVIASASVLSGTTGWTRFAWQSTLYIPECVGKDAKTYLQLTGNNGLKGIINIGCDSPESNLHDDNTSGDVKRGNFYDIVAIIDKDDITYQWNISPWLLEATTVQLAGISRLYIDKTEIDHLSGSDTEEIYYESDAPNLIFKSSTVKYGSMADELPLFEITEDKVNNKLKVNVNPDLPVNSTLLTDPDQGFWVISGNIQKWVSVKEVDLKPYLRLLPKKQTISVRNIANETYYEMYFDYATNSVNSATNNLLTLALASGTNTNPKTVFEDNTDVEKCKGVFIEICDENKEAVTKRIALSTTAVTLNTTQNLLSGKTYPEDGYIRVTVCDPTNPSYYSKPIKGKFKASVTNRADLTPAEAEFTIEPNPTSYTVHFKAINETWSNPHIYVYQPLYYNGLPVFGTSGDSNINWLEYSFTGNRAFKGWKKDMGQIDDLTMAASTFNDGGGSPVKGYHVGDVWGDPGKDNPDKYYENVSLIDKSTSGCSNCRNYGPYYLWPGMGMTKESNGWWKIELPLLAKPGTALIMFADGHTTDTDVRYPGGGVPGIPLPDFSDREAWYLYDASRYGNQSSFSDDERNSYTVTSTARKIGLYWHENTTTYSGILFFENPNGNWSNYWPKTDWSTRTATKIGEWYLVVLTSDADIAAFNKMTTTLGGGIQWKGSSEDKSMWWGNKSFHKDRSFPNQFSDYDLTESYQIWF